MNILIKYSIYYSLILSILLGISMFIASFEKGAYGLIFRINQNGIGVAGACFIDLVMIFAIINIVYLLKQLPSNLEPKSYDQILILKKLWSLPINILYIYSFLILITLPTVITNINKGEMLELYANILLLMGQISLFLIVLLFPGYFVHKIIKIAKDYYLEPRYLRLKRMKCRIARLSNQREYLHYIILQNNINIAEKIDEWPSLPEIVKILITAMIGIIPLALNIIKSINM